MLSINLRVILKKKPLVDTKDIKGKELKHVTTENKSQRKKAEEKERNEGTIKQLENNQRNGNSKSLAVNNYFKFNWIKFIKFPNQKTQSG